MFTVVIKPTIKQLNKIPKWDHTEPLERIMKKQRMRNLVVKNEYSEFYNVMPSLAQDEKFLYIQWKVFNKNKISTCKKGDYNYCLPRFSDTWDALTDEEVKTINDEHYKEVEERIKNTKLEVIGIIQIRK